MNQGSDYKSIAERLVKSTSRIQEYQMRVAYFYSKIRNLSEEGIVEILDTILKTANEVRSLHNEVLDIIAAPDAMKEHIGIDRWKKVLEITEKKGYFQLLILLGKEIVSAEVEETYPSEEMPYDFEDITIGERKSYAHSTDPDMISKLLRDPEPMVIESLLKNPRLTEKEVLTIVTKRPVNPQILEVVSRSLKWNSSYTIKDAIIRNPFTPALTALKLLPTLMRQDLEEIASDGSLSQYITVSAKDILKQKRGRTDEFYVIEDSNHN